MLFCCDLCALVSCQSFLDLRVLMESCCVKETVVSLCCLLWDRTGPYKQKLEEAESDDSAQGLLLAPWTVATRQAAPEQGVPHAPQCSRKGTDSKLRKRQSLGRASWAVAFKFIVRYPRIHPYLICLQLSTLIIWGIQEMLDVTKRISCIKKGWKPNSLSFTEFKNSAFQIQSEVDPHGLMFLELRHISVLTSRQDSSNLPISQPTTTCLDGPHYLPACYCT